MAQIPLEFDRSNGLFVIFVILDRKVHDFSSNSSMQGRPIYVKRKFYLDTGTNRTAITEEVANELRVDIDHLPKEKSIGIGGFIQSSIINDIAITVLDTEEIPYTFQLDKIQIISTSVREKVKIKNGVLRARGKNEENMPCLFGLDSVEKLGGKLSLDMKDKKGMILL